MLLRTLTPGWRRTTHCSPSAHRERLSGGRIPAIKIQEANSDPSVDQLIEKDFDLHRKRRVPVPIRLVIALAALIGLGTTLQLLPGITTRLITLIDAEFFTATSAAAVTGLAVLSTSTDSARLGQWVILLR